MLRTLQLEFLEALNKNTAQNKRKILKRIAPPKRGTSKARFEIYHYAFWARQIECLQEDFPGVQQKLGHDAFSKLAVRYLKHHPSRYNSLVELGRDFPQFIKTIHPKLAPLAIREWTLIQSFYAPEHEVLDFGVLAEKWGARFETKLTRSKLVLNPSVFLLKGPPLTLVYRMDGWSRWKRLNPFEFEALRGLQRGCTVGDVCGKLERKRVQPSKVQRMFSDWAARRLFTKAICEPF